MIYDKYINIMDTLVIINEIVNEKDSKNTVFTVVMEDDWIVIKAYRTLGRLDHIPHAWVSALNSNKWNNVPKSTKIDFRYFGPSHDQCDKNSQKWMEDYFGSNFKMTCVSLG